MIEGGKRLPLIFDITRGSHEDGPGIRTVVFFKGCPLNCLWCHNPEAIDSEVGIAYYQELCINCRSCLEVCQSGAIGSLPFQDIDRSLCKRCGLCTEVCPARALRKVGRSYEVQELVEYLLKDRVFYETSNGGVTFSGGEPTLNMDYLSMVIRELKKENIHITLETSGYFDLQRFEELILPYIDLIYYDLKIYDHTEHQKFTSVPNDLILSNFHSLFSLKQLKIVPSIPLIPGITDSVTNLSEIAQFLGEEGCNEYRLLPYNPLGISKRSRVGMPLPKDQSLSESFLLSEEEERLQNLFRKLIRKKNE